MEAVILGVIGFLLYAYGHYCGYTAHSKQVIEEKKGYIGG
jgi:hypothetical protein